MRTFVTVAEPIEQTFHRNVDSVHRLIDFDHVLLEYCTHRVSDIAEKMHKAGYDNRLAQTADRAVQQLKLIRQHDSLRPQYAEMFNQSLVLLVLYFGSSIRDLFKAGFIHALHTDKLGNLNRQEVKIPLSDLKSSGEEFLDKLTEVFLSQKDISFQDMQSIARAFGDNFGFRPEKNKCVNNIILAQACRHVIVHNGSKVDGKLLRQITDATPRDVKITLTQGHKIEFQPDEVRLVGESMKEYLHALCVGLTENFQSNQ